ncbi:hypothetical protein HK104_005079 [Borealophlyctis nickersoniae]|nr:hypothetical protein HK104_005079 [Borealophlyctis nickersoniae]
MAPVPDDASKTYTPSNVPGTPMESASEDGQVTDHIGYVLAVGCLDGSYLVLDNLNRGLHDTLTFRCLNYFFSSPPPNKRHSRAHTVTSTAPTTTLTTAVGAPAQPDQDISTYLPGVVYEYYKGDFSMLPDFYTLEPVACGVMEKVAVDAGTEVEVFDTELGQDGEVPGNFAVRFTTLLKIPHAGTWTFYLSSNDGSVLYVAGKKVIMNDGKHFVEEKEGKLRIPKPGFYPATVGYFHKNGKTLEGIRTGATLALQYYCPGNGWILGGPEYVPKQPIPSTAYFYNPTDEKIARLLRGDGSSTHYLPNSDPFDETSDTHVLAQTLRDTRERLQMVETALEDERRFVRNIIADVCGVLPGYPREGEVERGDEGGEDEDEVEKGRRIREEQMRKIASHTAQVRKLLINYFFSVGTSIKMGEGVGWFSVQDTYEQCMSQNVAVEVHKALEFLLLPFPSPTCR